MNDFEYYKINIRGRKHSQVKTVFVMSNLFQKDMVKRMFSESNLIVLHGAYVNPSCNMFQVMNKAVEFDSIVYVTRLYPEDVMRLEKEGEVKRWKRVYKI